MSGKRAKILSDQHIEDLLFFADNTRQSDRNRVIVLLSMKAGLRAAEIANLTWDMVVGPTGGIGTSIELHDDAAKMGSGRTIPIHSQLRTALLLLRQDNLGVWTGHSVGTRRPNDPAQYRRLVRARLRCTRVGWVLLAFWSTHLHYASRSRRS